MNTPNPPNWTLNSCFHVFCSIWVHLGLFGCLTRCKTGSASEFFTTNTTDPPPLDPKLMLFCISYYLGALGTIWLCYNTQSKTGQTGAKVRDTKSRQNFSQRTHPIHPNGPKTHIFVCFILFQCTWDYLVGSQNMMENVQNWCESSCHEVALDLFATNKPDPPHWTLNSCFGVFRISWGRLGLFGCVTTPSVKRVKLVKNFVP